MKSGTKFDRNTGFFCDHFTYIGKGLPGGKASGLALMQDIIHKHFPDDQYEGMIINIPKMTVLLSNVFDEFMENNSLYEIALSDVSDEEIAINFIKASFEGIYAGDLYYMVEKMDQPLAIRSSSILEDSLNEPFAGIYETKMVANNQYDKNERFKALVNAIKFVYASLFFKQSKNYFKSIKKDIRLEKMGVILQEVVGNRYENYFHPLISGVLKSYNFYPSDNIKPESGFAALAFGLGKTIVNGENCWSYCPEFPRTPQPFNDIKDMLNNTQKKYWTVNMGEISNYNPIEETEYLKRNSIFDIEDKKPLNYICSTYDYINDSLSTGYIKKGAPLLDFSPILKAESLPLNKVINKILCICEEETKSKIEIEFAVSLNHQNDNLSRFSLLQLRPIAVSNETVELPDDEKLENNLILSSNNVMGNGITEEINDIVYLRPDNFDVASTPQIAREIEELNSIFVKNNRKYILMGFGRWGTTDPWCGIPVKWPQISNAKVIVETVLPSMRADFSQGAHFFHNMTAHKVFYFSVDEKHSKNLDWKWIQEQRIFNETRYVRHIRVDEKLRVLVDGRCSKGVILK